MLVVEPIQQVVDGNFQLNLPGHHGGSGEAGDFTTVSLNYRRN